MQNRERWRNWLEKRWARVSKEKGRGNFPALFSGAEGTRTPDLLNAIQVLSQLSYGPMQVELRGFEPLTSTVRLSRSPS